MRQYRTPDPALEERGPTGATAAAPKVPGAGICALLMVSLLASAPAPAAESLPPRRYDVTVETVMPHLEEALRYATTRETRCFGLPDLPSAFPILGHEALAGCRLDQESRDDESVSYLLICTGAPGTKSETTGRARWQLAASQLTGTLDVKLGGKNMTFYQRVTARAVGGCTAEAK